MTDNADDSKADISSMFESIDEVVKTLKEKTIVKEDLTIKQRREVVAYLRIEKNYTQGKIAEILGCDQETVSRHFNAVRKAYGKLAEKDGYDVPGLVSRLIMEAEASKNAARKKGDYNSVWRIQCELTVMLDKLKWIPDFKRRGSSEGESPRTREELIKQIIRMFGDDLKQDDEIPGFEGMGLLQAPSDGVDPEIL